MARRVIVFHSGYGCDTGCCGHVVQMTGDNSCRQVDRFTFDHPYGEDERDFVRRIVTEEFGVDHVADIDWNEILVVDE